MSDLVERLKDVEKIDGFRPADTEAPFYAINFNDRLIVFNASEYGCPLGGLSELLGICFTHEDVTRNNYSLNIHDVLEKAELPLLTKNGRAAFMTEFNKLVSGEIDSFHIHPTKEHSDTEMYHIHIFGKKAGKDYMLQFIDLTEITRTKRELEKANYELEKANKLLRKLAKVGENTSKILHEIKNSVTSISGFAQRLQKSLKEGTSLRDYADIIFGEGQRLDRLAKDSLYFTKKPDLQNNQVDLSQITQELYQKREYSQLNIEISMEMGTGVYTCGDKDRLYEVFMNVIDNAIEKEGVTKINIRTYNRENESVFEVEDNGKSITPEDISKIFEPFYTTKMKGTGLGLAISNQTIEYHNGKIDVKSEPGSTVFSVVLPAFNGTC